MGLYGNLAETEISFLLTELKHMSKYLNRGELLETEYISLKM